MSGVGCTVSMWALSMIGRRLLALGRPLADEIADLVARANNPNVLQHRLEDRHHAIFVAPVAIDAEDVDEDLEQAVVVDGDRNGWRGHRKHRLQTAARDGRPRAGARSGFNVRIVRSMSTGRH